MSQVIGDGKSKQQIATWFVCIVMVWFAGFTAKLQAQGSSGYPRADYWAALAEFNEGEFRSAATAFNRTSRIKTAEGEWIDGICHRAMLGECFYQMGQSRQALQQYDMALSLFASNPQWMMRLYMPNVLPQSFRSTRKAVSYTHLTLPTIYSV